MSTQNAHGYWRSTIQHVRVEIERLEDAIDTAQRQDCFRSIEALEGSLRVLRASIRNNMDSGATD